RHYWDTWGMAQQTGGTYGDIDTADWSATLSAIGQDISQNIEITNIVITDTLPGEVVYRSAQAPPDGFGPPLEWDIGTLAVGEKGTITLLAEVTNFGDGYVENEATISGTGTVSSVAVAPTVVLITATHTATATPTYTVTESPTVTSTKTWSATLTDTSTFTPTPTITKTSTWTLTHTNTPTYTYTSTYTYTPTPYFSFELDIVNEAGEIVKTFIGLNVGEMPEEGEWFIGTEEVVFDVHGGVFRELEIGDWAISWDGSLDDEGTIIANGAYQVVVRLTDVWGQWEEEVGTLVVMKVAGEFKVTVRDEAGRLVRSINASNDIGNLGSLRAEPALIKPGAGTNAKAFIKSDTCELKMAGSSETLHWDGKNEDGQIVRNGLYRIVVEKQDIEGAREIKEVLVTVVRGAEGAIDNVVAYPNPKVVRTDDASVRIKYEVVLADAVVKVKVYSVAGKGEFRP
ncbi:unnamed protein product, partial [marine sediment metagenome]